MGDDEESDCRVLRLEPGRVWWVAGTADAEFCGGGGSDKCRELEKDFEKVASSNI